MHTTPPIQYTQRFEWMQSELFPLIRADLISMSPLLEKLTHILDWVRVEEFTHRKATTGNPGHEHGWLANAFIAKAVLNLPTSRALIERLKIDSALRRICGFSLTRPLPSESTFSRAIATFAEEGLAERAHAHLIRSHLGPHLIGHLSRDSTAIIAREQPEKKDTGNTTKKMTVATQRGQSLPALIAQIPTACNRGTKLPTKLEGL